MTVQKVPFKKANEFALPILGLGTWEVGGQYRRNPFHNDQRDVTALRWAVAHGLTHIDTAEIYAAGHAEELVGQAIKGNERGKLTIVSKIEAPHFNYDDVIAAAQASLKRLGTSYLDGYLLHSPTDDGSIAAAARALDSLIEHELVRWAGVSNFLIPHLEEALAHSKYGIKTNQIHVSLAARGYEDNGVLEFCQKHAILVTAFRPLDKGRLCALTNELMRQMVAKYQRPPAQIALRWVMQQPNMVAIFKASRIEHLEEDIGALEWELEGADVDRLTREYPRGRTLMYRYDAATQTNRSLS